MDLQDKILAEISESLGSDIERTAIQGLINDSEKLRGANEEIEQLKKDAAHYQNIIGRLKAEIDPVKDKLQEAEAKLAAVNADNEVLSATLRDFEVKKAQEMLTMALEDKSRAMGILDRQNRFYNQTTKRSLIVDGGEIGTGYYDNNGVEGKRKVGQVPLEVTDTVSQNDD